MYYRTLLSEDKVDQEKTTTLVPGKLPDGPLTRKLLTGTRKNESNTSRNDTTKTMPFIAQLQA
jgi:hypothetical protein